MGIVGVGVFPQCKEILLGSASFGNGILQGLGAGETEMGECADWSVDHHAAMVDDFLKPDCHDDLPRTKSNQLNSEAAGLYLWEDLRRQCYDKDQQQYPEYQNTGKQKYNFAHQVRT